MALRGWLVPYSQANVGKWRPGYMAESGEQAGEPPPDRGRGDIRRCVPNLSAEDLDLGVAAVAGGQDLSRDPGQVDVPVPAVAAAEQGIGGGRAGPGGKPAGGATPPGAGAPRGRPGVPPHLGGVQSGPQ